MPVNINMSAGDAGGMMKLGGGDIPSLIEALDGLTVDQKYRCDLIINVDGDDRVFHRNTGGVYSTGITTTSTSVVQYFLDTTIPSCYKREVVNGTATDTTYNSIVSWSLLYSDDTISGGNTYPASQVSYDNTESGLDADNAQDAIDEVADRINSNIIETSVNISKYTSSNQYTFPSDGYVQIRSVSAGSYISFKINGIAWLSRQAGSDYQLLYVKKGMKGYVYGTQGEYEAYFYPLQ